MCELPQSTPQLLFRSGSAAPPTLPSFPTRRSSDLDHLRDRIHAGAVELAGRERLLVGAVDLILDEERAVFPHIGERRQPLARRRVGEAGDAPLEDPAVDLLDPELLARAIGRLEVLPHAEAPVGIDPPRELDPELVLLPHLPESGRLVGLPGEVEGPALP